MTDSAFRVTKNDPAFHIVVSPSQILLKILLRSETHPGCLVVVDSAGLKIASMDFNGVVTAHVEDPVKEINILLEAGVCDDVFVSYKIQAYLLMFRTHFLTPRNDSWKKNPLL